MDKDVLEHLLACGLSLEAIGRRVGRHPSTVGYWVKKHGLSAAHATRHAARGGLSRERLEKLIESGGTHRSIAAELGVSVATVRHWLKRTGSKPVPTLGGASLGKASGRVGADWSGHAESTERRCSRSTAKAPIDASSAGRMP